MCISGMVYDKPSYGERELAKALKLWEKYSENYRNLFSEHEQLETEAAALNIKTSTPRPKKGDEKDFKNNYEIPFLRKETKAEAEEYLEGLSAKEIRNEIILADSLDDAYVYRTIRERIKELRTKIKNKSTKNKTIFGAPQAQKL